MPIRAVRIFSGSRLPALLMANPSRLTASNVQDDWLSGMVL